MPLQETAPSGVTVQAVHCRRDGDAECLTAKSSCVLQRDSFAPVLGRFAIICAALAACATGAITAAGGAVHEANFAQVLAPTFVPAPPNPRQQLASVVIPIPERDLTTSALASSRIDRVPFDFLIEEALGSGSGSPDEILVFGPMKVRRHVVETIVKAARATEMDPVLLMAIADKESSFSTQAKARTSSATGLFQFIESTWLRVVRDFGAKHGLEKEARAIAWSDDELVIQNAAERTRILELRREPYVAALLAAEMLKRDRTRIAQSIGRELSESETYLAHFLGPDDAEKFMAKVVDEPTSSAAKLLPKPAKANKSIFFAGAGRKSKKLSVAEVHKKFEAMMGLRLERYRNVHEVTGSTALAEATSR